LFNNVWFSDEAHLHLDAVVNKQNMRFSVLENRSVIHEKVHHAPRITVWVTISTHGLPGPIFFEETVNTQHYLSILHNTFVHHLLATGLPLQTQWFIKDGARSHSANVVLDFLHDTFQLVDCYACGQNWPLNSLDLNPRDYFIWGFIKENIFPKTTANNNATESTNHSDLQ
jgi:hypothetical protein